VQQQDILTVRQAATAAQPNGPLWCELVHEREKILVVDLIATQLQAKGATPPASHKGVRPRQLRPSPERATITLHQWSELVVLSTGEDSRHHHHTTGGVRLLAPV
jgi:hypothetical protein